MVVDYESRDWEFQPWLGLNNTQVRKTDRVDPMKFKGSSYGIQEVGVDRAKWKVLQRNLSLRCQ